MSMSELKPIDTAPRDGTFLLLAWVEEKSLMFKVERGAFHVGYQQWHVPSVGFNVVPRWWDWSHPHPLFNINKDELKKYAEEMNEND